MSENYVDVVRRAYEAFSRGDIEGVLASLDPDVDWVTPGPADLPIAGRRRGREAVAGFFQTLGSLMDFLAFEPQTFIAADDRVVVLGTDTVRLKSTGKTLTFEFAHSMRIEGGHIVAFQEYIELSELVAAIREARAVAGA